MSSVVAWGKRAGRRFVAMAATLFVVAPIAETMLPEPMWILVTVVAILVARQLA